MSYAVVYGNNISTYFSKSEAVHIFNSVVVRHANAQLFVIAASGTYQNLTQRVLVHVVA